MQTVLDVEQPLIRIALRDIDSQLRHAEEILSWNSQGWSRHLLVIFIKLQTS